MTFEEWVEGVPAELRGDPLWRMKVYRLAVFAGDLAWHDVSRLIRDQRAVSLSDQLFRAVGSIAANIIRTTHQGENHGSFSTSRRPQQDS